MYTIGAQLDTAVGQAYKLSCRVFTASTSSAFLFEFMHLLYIKRYSLTYSLIFTEPSNEALLVLEYVTCIYFSRVAVASITVSAQESTIYYLKNYLSRVRYL